MAENKRIWEELLKAAKPPKDVRHTRLLTLLVTTARELLKILFYSGSEWGDLRIAGSGKDSRSRRPADLLEVLLLLLLGKTGKLFFFDAKNPDKVLSVDRKTLLNPNFLKGLKSGLPVEEPAPPSDYQRLMNRLYGWYQKEMDDYRLQLALYETKQLQHQRLPGRKLSPEAIRDLTAIQGKSLPEATEQLEKERQAMEQQAAELQVMEQQAVEQYAAEQQAMELQAAQQQEAQRQAEEQAAEATVAEKRCREALHVLGRNDAKRHEIVDAMAVLLTCYILASWGKMDAGVEFFEKSVGEIRNKPPFAQMTRDPEELRKEVLDSASQVLDQPGDMAEKMQDIVFHRYVKIALAMKAPVAETPKPVTKAVETPKPVSKPAKEVKPAAPVPVRVLTRRLGDDTK